MGIGALGGTAEDIMGEPDETSLERRKRIEREQSEEMELALLAWIDCQSKRNSRRLYRAGCAYFGKKPASIDPI